MSSLSNIIAFLLYLLMASNVRAVDKLQTLKPYQSGLQAMADDLPQLAVKRFEAVLQADLSEADRATALEALATAQLQAGNSTSASATLAQELLSQSPNTPYLRAIATTLGGNYEQALKLFSAIPPKAPHHDEAQLCIAHLQTVLGKREEALITLQNYLKATDSSSAAIQCTIAELALDLERTDLAAATLNQITPPTNASTLLRAKLLLTQKQYAQAIDLLQQAPSQPYTAKQLKSQHLILAEAYHLSGNSNQALQVLNAFIKKHPNSAELGHFFQRINSWMPADISIYDPVVKDIANWAHSTTPPSRDIGAYARFVYAANLAKTPTGQSPNPKLLRQALLEFSILRIHYPDHILASASLSHTANALLLLNELEKASFVLESMVKLNLPISPQARSQASFLLGELHVKSAQYETAAQHFAKAAEQSTDQALKNAAILNEGNCFITIEDSSPLQTFLKQLPPRYSADLLLEKAIQQNTQKSASARPLLQQFIAKYPDHPRLAEAQLLLMENAIFSPPIDLPLCQTSMLELSDKDLTTAQFKRFNQAKYYLSSSFGDYSSAAEAMQETLKLTAEPELESELRVMKAQALFKNGDYNAARQLFREIANDDFDPTLTHYARYYQALSAKLEGTPQAINGAEAIFHKITRSSSPLKTESTLQLANIYLLNGSIKKAKNLLTSIYKPESSSPLQNDIALLLAEAYQNISDAEDPMHDQKALSVYNAILQKDSVSTRWRHHIHYTKALLLQKLKRYNEALENYYQVINHELPSQPTKQNPAHLAEEWLWYYRCGFNAIALLEQLDMPKPAIKLATKLSKTHGPRAAEAAEKIESLKMKHMIW